MNQPPNAVTHGDIIENLPTDAAMPSHDELQIINSIFRENKASKGRIFSEAKEGVLLIILFIIFSLEPVDNVIKKLVTSANNKYVLVFIKAIIFAVIFYVIKNLNLIQK